MKTINKDMDFIRLTEYIEYAFTPLTTNKCVLLITTLAVGMFSAIISQINLAVTWISMILVIHSMFIILYAALSLMDWVTGLISSVIVEKQRFISGRFFKKPFLIMFCLFMLYTTVALSDTFNSYPHKDNYVLQGMLSTVVFLFEGIKIGLMVSFIVYELTSLKENFKRMKMYDFVKVVDWFLIPFTKIQSYINRKFEKTIEDEVGNEIKEDKTDTI